MIEITATQFLSALQREGIDGGTIQFLVVDKLIEYNKKVASAESCTGGLVSKRLTDVGGVSQVFECGVCSYANRIKSKLLGVSGYTLDTVGAVSPETAGQMAAGVMRLADSDFGISTTGIAGPSGGTEEKPVGLVYMAVASKDGVDVIKADFSDLPDISRDKIRSLASTAVLYFLYKRI